LAPLSLEPGQDLSPLWTPNGARVIWTSTRGGGNPNLYWRAADGTGSIERLSTTLTALFPTTISPDGRLVLAFSGVAGANPDRMESEFTIVHVDSSGAKHPAPSQMQSILRDSAFKAGAEISPDGNWMVYQSLESGESQVYVRPFPNVDDSRQQISTSGGSRPAWARNGRELFYIDHEGLLTSVAMQVNGVHLRPGTPVRLFNTSYYLGATARGYPLRGYDVSADGQRFLVLKDVIKPDQHRDDSVGRIEIVLNWFEELKRLTRTAQ
jgi:serine/threonine-protein kinase